jgi:hypothetical protein
MYPHFFIKNKNKNQQQQQQQQQNGVQGLIMLEPGKSQKESTKEAAKFYCQNFINYFFSLQQVDFKRLKNIYLTLKSEIFF